MSGYELQADISHWQSPFEVDSYPYKRIGLKCTDGANSVDPDYLARVKAAHSKGIGVEHYCFAEAEDGASQARYLLAHVKFLKGDRIVIDAEVHGVTQQVVTDFIATIQAKLPHQGLVYGSPGFLNPAGIHSSHGWELWEAQYTTAAEPDKVPGFDGWTLWQFSQTSHVPGIGGQCDLSRVAPVKTPPKVKPRNLPLHIRGPLHLVLRWLRWYTVKGTRPLSTSARGKMLDTGTLADKALKVGVKK